MTRYLYSIYIIEYMLIIEIFLITIAVVLTIFFQTFFSYRERVNNRLRDQLKTHILDMICKSTPFDIHTFESYTLKLPVVIRVVHEIDTKMKGEYWDALKHFLLTVVMRDEIYHHLESRNWQKRGWALQGLSLTKERTHEIRILKLLQDETPVLRFSAASSGIKLKTRQSIDAVLNAMEREPSYARYAYRDALLRADDEVYHLLVEKLKEERNPRLRICCLEILSQKMGYISHDLIANDLTSPELDLRWWATRALENMPTIKTIELLRDRCVDSSWEIRSLAARNIGLLGDKDAIVALSELLEDEHWYVRLSCALRLNHSEKRGKTTSVLSQRRSRKRPSMLRNTSYQCRHQDSAMR